MTKGRYGQPGRAVMNPADFIHLFPTVVNEVQEVRALDFREGKLLATKER